MRRWKTLAPRGPRRVVTMLGVALLAAASLAAEPGAQAPAGSGKLAGILAGVILISIVGYAFACALKPIASDPESGLETAAVTLGALAIVKTAALSFFPGFGPDVGSYQAWALQIANLGPAHTYQAGYFLDYPPGYLYALWVAGVLTNLLHATGDTQRLIAESPAIVADFFLAALVYSLVRRDRRTAIALGAMLMIALNPVLLFDTVVWGQSDSVLTFTMLLSVIALLASQYELCWAMAAISVLVKPQGLMLAPVLAWWTMLETDVRCWARCAVVGISVFVIGIAPFQVGHPWNWILELYTSTAAYYHETSVNAFNLMALIGGLRQPDSGTVAGISYFGLGMSLLVPLYGFVAWILWRKRTAKTLLYAAFITIFGFFLLAPRMHERYLYPAIVFAIPLALESIEMLAVFGALSLTCLFNLAYVLHTLKTIVFFDARDGLAMAASALNVAIFAAAAIYGAVSLEGAEVHSPRLNAILQRLTRQPSEAPEPEERPEPLGWIRADTIVISAMLALGGIIRFWHLNTPPEIVFDEVHFVGQARHYLHSEPFLDPHPPLAKLLIALGIRLFGDHPWSWRIANAAIGTALIGVTYLLVRRMLHSRLAASLAAAFIAFDGVFLVDSRIAVIDIVYITLAAVSYLLFFRFVETPGLLERRKILPWLGIALGLCVASKLYIPAVTFLLVMGFLVYVLYRSGAGGRLRDIRIIGAVALTGSVASIAYIAVFLPHYWLGWWGGIEDLFKYYQDIVGYEKSVSTATHPYASPWWSWPLMLRAVAYWQNFPKTGNVATIWFGSNPLLCWGALTAITIAAVQAVERPNLVRSFLVLGYIGYLGIWIWIGRTLFLYHYMASTYLAFIALAGVLAQCWDETAEPWEHIALLLTMTPVFILGLGTTWGAIAFMAMFLSYMVILGETPYPGRFVSVVFLATAVVLFVYFFPVWTAIPIDRAGYYARMWLEGPGLRNWI
ncbi:MAG TPA: phospholipid carrier-dependent glycosyltransferase [Candidatus Binataceae bacterium]|nr:phospholipid carrier-dependent glycosyltransferase [Candidatus Binataceae bacterium]